MDMTTLEELEPTSFEYKEITVSSVSVFIPL